MITTQRIATMMSALALMGLSAAPLGAQTTEQKGGPQEGIKVHGHWTITVRNPDGTIASTREFENALLEGTAGGAELLTALLTDLTLRVGGKSKWATAMPGWLSRFATPQQLSIPGFVWHLNPPGPFPSPCNGPRWAPSG